MFNLDEEVICGHLVTKETKKLWAVEMELAQKLLDVCNNNNLKIWADAGTLLGAVRHKGFIPWDDDMDFCMMRKDYNKLLEIGPYEFKEPFFFQSIYTDNIGGGLVHVRNSNTTWLESGYKNYKDRNSGCAIDVFVMDNVPNDTSLLYSHYKKVRFLRRMVNNYKLLDPNYLSGSTRIANTFLRGLFKVIDVNRVQSKIVNLLSSIDSKDSRYVTLLDFYAASGTDKTMIKLRDRDCYLETVYLPFYEMQMPVPKGYHEILSSWYGDYMKPVKGTQMHHSFIVDTERSYKDVIIELNIHKNHY